MSNELNQQIDELLKNEIVDRHSYFQLRYFVVGKEPTNQARMWRCLNELRARKENMDSIILEKDNLKDEIELLELEEIGGVGHFGIDSPESEKKKDEIRQRQKNRKLKAMNQALLALDKKMQYVTEEADFFVKAFNSLNKNEKLKPFDDMESQIRYWNEKLAQDLNTKVMVGLPPDSELLKTILALPDNTPVKQAVIQKANAQLPELAEGNE